MLTYRLMIKGRVQGVGYRRFTQAQMQKLGLAGWVRNVSDGSVEVQISCDESLLNQIVETLRKGPSLSSVAYVEVQKILLRHELPSPFEIVADE